MPSRAGCRAARPFLPSTWAGVPWYAAPPFLPGSPQTKSPPPLLCLTRRQFGVSEDAHKEQNDAQTALNRRCQEATRALDRDVLARWRAQKQGPRFRQGHVQDGSAGPNQAARRGRTGQTRDEPALEVRRVCRANIPAVLRPKVEGLNAGEQREQGFSSSGF